MHRRLLEFVHGDRVVARVPPERFPRRIVKKLHAKMTGSYRILSRMYGNAYKMNIVRNSGISSIFNVEVLTLFHEPSVVQFPASSQSFVSLPGASSSFTCGDLFNTLQNMPMPLPSFVPAWRDISTLSVIEDTIDRGF